MEQYQIAFCLALAQLIKNKLIKDKLIKDIKISIKDILTTKLCQIIQIKK